jgi:hypothetical protein
MPAAVPSAAQPGKGAALGLGGSRGGAQRDRGCGSQPAQALNKRSDHAQSPDDFGSRTMTSKQPKWFNRDGCRRLRGAPSRPARRQKRRFAKSLRCIAKNTLLSRAG